MYTGLLLVLFVLLILKSLAFVYFLIKSGGYEFSISISVSRDIFLLWKRLSDNKMAISIKLKTIIFFNDKGWLLR